MVRTELEAIVGNLGAFYERKSEPSAMTLELWMQKVKNIPSEAIPWIQDKIMDECEYWPKNITATMWAFYNAWLDAHPEKRAHRDHVDCPDCQGGWLVLQKIVLNKFGLPMYETAIPTFAAPCGTCRQLPMRKFMTMFQALENGYEKVNLESHHAARRSVKEMVEGIGKPMPKARVYAD